MPAVVVPFSTALTGIQPIHMSTLAVKIAQITSFTILGASTLYIMKKGALHGLKNVASSQIVNASTYSKNKREKIKKTFTSEWDPNNKQTEIVNDFTANRFTTEAGLTGAFIKHNDSDVNTPTVILFQPRESSFEESINKHSLDNRKNGVYRWMLENPEQKCNFVLFDYRGVGASKGKAMSANDLIKDGKAVYEHTKRNLGTNQKNIHFCRLL